MARIELTAVVWFVINGKNIIAGWKQLSRIKKYITVAMAAIVAGIGIPLFMEQQYNLETMQKKHYGILLPKDKVSKETIEEALNRAFTDKELIEGAKEGGEIVRKYLIDPEYSAESKAAEIIKEYLDEKYI